MDAPRRWGWNSPRSYRRLDAPRRWSWTSSSSSRSCRVLRVLADVVVGEIGGPDPHLLITGVQVDDHRHLAPGQVDQLAGIPDATGPTDLHTVERHVQLVGLEDRSRRADGGQHPPPVRVVAE